MTDEKSTAWVLHRQNFDCEVQLTVGKNHPLRQKKSTWLTCKARNYSLFVFCLSARGEFIWNILCVMCVMYKFDYICNLVWIHLNSWYKKISPGSCLKPANQIRVYKMAHEHADIMFWPSYALVLIIFVILIFDICSPSFSSWLGWQWPSWLTL